MGRGKTTARWDLRDRAGWALVVAALSAASGGTGCRSGAAASADAVTLGADQRARSRDLRSHPPDAVHDGASPRSRCVSRAALAALSQPLTCESKHIVAASSAQLPYDCHTQGVAFHPASGAFVVTCMDQGSGTRARLLAFPGAANHGGQWRATDVHSAYVDSATRHPSAIQIDRDVFAVAIARSSTAGPSIIRLYRVETGPKLCGPLATDLVYEPNHIGALAYATLGGATHLVGCGWDCATLTLWRASGVERTSGFSLVRHAPTSSLVASGGVDTNVGEYNSLYLTRRCDDDQPLLFASHDDWLDVWEVRDLGKASVTLRKIAKRKITESVVQWKDRPLLYEGMTIEPSTSGGLHLWAAPHDFGTEACPSGSRCSQYVYRCRFGS